MSTALVTGSTPNTAHEQSGYLFLVAVVADLAQRFNIVEACRDTGVSILAVARIAELERWPLGQIVITDSEHLTPFWQTVGAVEVIVLARTAEAGTAALTNGATRWATSPAQCGATAAMALSARYVLRSLRLIQRHRGEAGASRHVMAQPSSGHSREVVTKGYLE